MDDLIPISREDGGVLIGKVRPKMNIEYRMSNYFKPDEGSGNEKFENWQISGRKRAHTIPKEYYNFESEDEYRYNVLLTAINYIETDRCIITATSDDWECYPLYGP
jgi:hypothetical protein